MFRYTEKHTKSRGMRCAYEYATVKKDECNAADGRLGRSDRKETDNLKRRSLNL